MSNPLFRVTQIGPASDSFISIGVTDEVYKLAKMTNMEWAQEGMSGYDIDEFLHAALTSETMGEITTDPEFSNWYGYYKSDKSETKDVQDELAKAKAWSVRAAKDILAYIPQRMRAEADRLESDLVTRYEVLFDPSFSTNQQEA